MTRFRYNILLVLVRPTSSTNSVSWLITIVAIRIMSVKRERERRKNNGDHGSNPSEIQYYRLSTTGGPLNPITSRAYNKLPQISNEWLVWVRTNHIISYEWMIEGITTDKQLKNKEFKFFHTYELRDNRAGSYRHLSNLSFKNGLTCAD